MCFRALQTLAIPVASTQNSAQLSRKPSLSAPLKLRSACHLHCSVLQGVPSRGAGNSIDFKELAKTRPGEARTLEPMLSFGVTILTCQNGFDGSHAIRKMKTNGLMTPLQLLIGAHVQSSTQLSVFAGACVLAHATEPAQLVSSKECFRC